MYSKKDEIFYDDKIRFYNIVYDICYTRSMEMKENMKMKGKEIKFRNIYYGTCDMKQLCEKKKLKNTILNK